MEQNLEIIEDSAGRKIVVIRDIRFRNKNHIEWKVKKSK